MTTEDAAARERVQEPPTNQRISSPVHESHPEPSDSTSVTGSKKDAETAAFIAMHPERRTDVVERTEIIDSPSVSWTSRGLAYITMQHPETIELHKVQQKNKDLQDEIDKLQHKIDRFERDMSSVKRDKDKDIINLKRERDNLSTDLNQAKRSLLTLKQEKSKLDHECTELKRDKDGLINQNHNANGKLQRSMQQNKELQKHMEFYKKNISAANQPINETSDDFIKGKVDHLFNSIQNFVVKTFRNARFDYGLVPQGWKDWMIEYIPNANRLPQSEYYNIAISVVSNILTRHYEPRWSFGNLDHPVIRAVGELIVQLKPEEHAESKSWLGTTRRLIENKEPGLLNEAEENLCRRMVVETDAAIARAMHVDWNHDIERELARVFALGLDLFRLLHRQQAMFHVSMAPAWIPNEETRLFNPETMEDVRNLHDADSLAGCTISMSVFPLVHKMGDERGDYMDEPTFVSKAKVVPGNKQRRSPRKLSIRRNNTNSFKGPPSASPFTINRGGAGEETLRR